MLIRKLFRTIWIYKAQFLAMIIMLTLGVGIFVAFNVEWYSVEQNTSKFLEETGYADYRIISSTGFTEEDVSKIEDIYGKNKVSKYTTFDVQLESGENTNQDSLSMAVTENDNVSGFIVTEGNSYDETDDDGIWISDKYAKENDVELEENIIFSYNGIIIEGVVRGFIQSGENTICVQGATQIVPDYSKYGYAYISPKMLEKIFKEEVYSQIHIISDTEKEEFMDEIYDILGENTVIFTKEESFSYNGIKSQVEQGKIMATVLPVVFLIISALTMVTTMYRITDKERLQIGTLKALGFKNKKILIHYMMYAVVIGVAGIALGLVLGYKIAYLIFSTEGTMGGFLEMPYWDLVTPVFVYIVIISIAIILVLIALFSVNKILKECAAEILRPDAGTKVKPMKLEKLKIFHKSSFGVRWNLRDIVQHKSRTAMSLFGVIGCMIILIGSIGMNDTTNNFVDKYYNGAMDYLSKISLLDNATAEETQNIQELYESDISGTLNAKMRDKAIALDIYNVSNEFVKFVSKDGEYMELSDDGVYICTRLSEEFGLYKDDYIVVTLSGSLEEYTLKIIGVSSSVSENVMMTEEYANKVGIPYEIDTLYTNEENISLRLGMKKIQSREELIDSFDLLLNNINIMISILVIIGITLSVVVLYNLGIMNYSERYREMATLKVLGFRDKRISSLLISQNLWLSIVGIIIGIPLGYLVLEYLVDAMANEYEMNLYIAPKTYIISIALSLGVTLIVSLIIARKNKNIDMVQALKSPE